MVRKKLDNRIRVLIENCVALHHRSLFIVVGEKGRECIPILHEMLSKAEVKARPTVLWCYKKELGFSTHKKKRKRMKKAAAHGKMYLNENDPIENFIGSTNIRYCYYNETHSIMGQTFGMAILQDFEAITPNLLARTIETVEGGGLILMLLQSVDSIEQLYTMTMDVHARYRTESHQDVVCRFNQRLILSMTKCNDCLILEEKLNILPIIKSRTIEPIAAAAWNAPKSIEEQKLLDLKESLDDNQPVNVLIKKCKTLDQAEAVMKFIESLAEKTLRSTVTLTAARGRGKSAALGLAVAGAVAFKYPNIAVTSPHPENLKTFFKFVLVGLEALGYEKTTDYEEVRSTDPECNKAIIQINIHRKTSQRVRYISPNCGSLDMDEVELLVIDEAAAIPLPFVKALMGPYLVFLASTVNGYEGTGRSLSLKLISQLRKEAQNNSTSKMSKKSPTGRLLHELTLNESIRYKKGDKIEEWLNGLLCLTATVPPANLLTSPPSPEKCKLYYIHRDTLFSYVKHAERFLQNLVSILVASHYKNSPNDLQIMSDAPAHHVFCLCAPSNDDGKELPEVLVVLQVCLEGKLSQNTVKQELSVGRRSAGDLIPWTISQEFEQEDFAKLSGARVVRIATHPDYQGKGYGLKALQLLQDFYEGKFYQPQAKELSDLMEVDDDDAEVEEQVSSTLQPLFPPLESIKPSILDYLGVSYGLSSELLRFWKKAKFVPVYLASTPNQLTGEHSCIMLKQLTGQTTQSEWVIPFGLDFCLKTIETVLRELDCKLGMELLALEGLKDADKKDLSKDEIFSHLNDIEREELKEICHSQLTTRRICASSIPVLAKFYFTHRFKAFSLTEKEAICLFSTEVLNKPLQIAALNADLNLQDVNKELTSSVQKMAKAVLDYL